MSCRRYAYKDLDKYRNTRKKQKARYRDKTGSGLYKPKIWSEDENKLILEHSIPDIELSIMLKRSVNAIQIHRSKIKLKMLTERG